MASGKKLPSWKVREMRKMYATGEDMNRIATLLDTSRNSVKRYCTDIQLKGVDKLGNGERNQLLTSWIVA